MVERASSRSNGLDALASLSPVNGAEICLFYGGRKCPDPWYWYGLFSLQWDEDEEEWIETRREEDEEEDEAEEEEEEEERGTRKFPPPTDYTAVNSCKVDANSLVVSIIGAVLCLRVVCLCVCHTAAKNGRLRFYYFALYCPDAQTRIIWWLLQRIKRKEKKREVENEKENEKY